MVRVIATLISKPQTVSQTSEALAALVEPTQAEEGCISYNLYQSNDDPTEFITVEEFVDDAAIDAHMASAHIAAALAVAGEILAADPQIKRYALVK